jgi:hypothetical protein
MATRIQLRRDTAANWTTNNPTLATGEVGFETDSGKFKIGNGSSVWSALDYFLDSSDLLAYLTVASASTTYLTQASASTTYATKVELNNIDLSSASAAAVAAIVDSAPSTLNTLNELAAALGDDANFASTIATSLGNKLDISTASSTYLTQVNASTTYLTQASASATYATIGSGGGSSIPPAYVPFVSGGFYKSPGANGNGFVANQNSTYFGHFYVGATTSFDRIGCTAGTLTSSGNARLGIYTDSGGKPGTLVLDAGTVAYSTTNTAYLITINQSLTPGWYWLAFNAQSGTSQWFGSGGNQTSIQGVQRMGSTSVFTSMISGYEQSSVTGAFPASASAAFTTSNGIPSAYLRAT